MNFIWTVETLFVRKTEGQLSDVVVTANWSCRASNGTYSAVSSGCTEFAPPTGSFTPYPDLKPEQILGWCFSNGVNKSAIEANVNQQINNQINPPVVSLPLPWVPVVDVVVAEAQTLEAEPETEAAPEVLAGE